MEQITDTNQLEKDPTFKEIAKRIEAWLSHHKGETFDLDMVCRHCEITSASGRNMASQKLAYEVRKGSLEKNLKTYRYIDTSLIYLDWVTASKEANLTELAWPVGQDGTLFGFDCRVFIPQKGIIVIAGVTNTGKSTFCRNFLFKNMDTYQCDYFSSETSKNDFAEYVPRMTWAKPLKEDGTPKFGLYARNKDWKDVIRPDGINIIDWLNLGDKFYMIGEVLQGIKDKLNTGIALVAIQKDPNKLLGMGGMWSEHLASLYLSMDYGRVTVMKAKKWTEWNPNNKTWGFDIIDRGANFDHIRLLEKCGACWQGKKNGVPCLICHGTGWVDADNK